MWDCSKFRYDGCASHRAPLLHRLFSINKAQSPDRQLNPTQPASTSTFGAVILDHRFRARSSASCTRLLASHHRHTHVHISARPSCNASLARSTGPIQPHGPPLTQLASLGLSTSPTLSSLHTATRARSHGPSTNFATLGLSCLRQIALTSASRCHCIYHNLGRRFS